MTTFNITGGSEKQNKWASDIANKWISEIDEEIARIANHTYADTLTVYADLLQVAKANFLAGMEKITAKQIIEVEVAKRNIAKSLIAQALKKFEESKLAA